MERGQKETEGQGKRDGLDTEAAVKVEEKHLPQTLGGWLVPKQGYTV